MMKTRLVSSLARVTKLTSTQNARWSTTVAADKVTYFEDSDLAKAKPFEDMPSFPTLPWLGTSWIYFPIIGHYDLQKQHINIIDKRRRFGNIFKETIGSINLVMSCNADDMEVLFKNEGPYPSRGEIESLKAYRESRKQWYESTGVMILQGKEWHDLRSKAQKHLMKPKSIHAFLNPMQDVSRDLVKKIFLIRNDKKEIPGFLEELYNWALEAVALVGLDTRLGCLELNLSPDSDGLKMINSVQTQFDCMNKLEPFAGNLPFWKYFPTPTWRRFAKACDTFTEIAFRYINRSLDELKKNADNEDKELTLLQSMLMTEGMTPSGAVVMVADMLTAGIDTTSHTVGFFLYHMAKNPDKQERLYQEIIRLLPNKEDRITTEIFNEMKYLKACIKESARLTPIVQGLPRRIDHDIILSGYRVPAGAISVVAHQEIYRDERYFSDPNKFLPDRWLKKDEKFNPFAYVPFGIGTRSCIGRRLAELEIISVLTEITRNFKVEYHYEDIGMYSRLVSTPDKPLQYRFIER